MISNRFGHASGKVPTNPHRVIGLRQQQNLAIRDQASTVERGCDLLAMYRWKRKTGHAIVAFDGGGLWHFLSRCGVGSNTLFPTSKQHVALLLPTLQDQPGE